MKKLIPSLLLATFACSSAYADTSSATLAAGSSSTVDTADCLILATSVGIGLSANVEGTVYCREADGTDTSMIMVGTCHSGGLSKERDVTCIAKSVTVAGVTTTTYYPSDCGAGDVTVSVNGPSLFLADTATGGSMTENALGGPCDSTTVEAFVITEGDAT